MAKPYKLTAIDEALSPLQTFEGNLTDFLNDNSIPDDQKLLIFQTALRRVDKQKPYQIKPISVVNVADKIQEANITQSSASTPLLPLEDHLSRILDLLPVSYREQGKRLLNYLNESSDIKIDATNHQITLGSNTYNLIDLITDFVSNRKKTLSIDTNLLKYLHTSNFPKALVINRKILKDLTSFNNERDEEDDDSEKDDFKTLMLTSTPKSNYKSSSSSSNDSTLASRKKHLSPTTANTSVSIQKGSGGDTHLHAKWMKL